jgi:hypothetical protein
MRATWKASIALAAAGALALVVAGCEDSPLTAQTGWTLSMTANPGSVSLDPNTDNTATNVDLAATLLNDKGLPESGVTVYFAASIPGLASGKNGVKTDVAGIARDVLHVTLENATADITATASSASLKDTVTITVNRANVNQPPIASIVASPQNEQVSGGAVVFDGSTSTDPDPADLITMYRWVVTSTNPDTGADAKPNPIIVEGPGVSGISIPGGTMTAFRNTQDLTVTLFVTDDPNAPALFAADQPIAYRGQHTQTYSIVAVKCENNTAPTAVLAGATEQQIFGTAQSTVSFQLDGGLSSDPETAIQSYIFSCGNGASPVVGSVPSKVTCAYLVDTVPRTYTATLAVVDRGTGQMVDGAYQCAKTSSPVSITVTVSPLTSGG